MRGVILGDEANDQARPQTSQNAQGHLPPVDAVVVGDGEAVVAQEGVRQQKDRGRHQDRGHDQLTLQRLFDVLLLLDQEARRGKEGGDKAGTDANGRDDQGEAQGGR